METEGKTFPEVVEELAHLAGVALPQLTPEAREAAVRRVTLVEANEAAATWFQRQLSASRETLAYLEERRITPEEVAKFRLGFAPDGNALAKANLGNANDMIEAGLLARSEDARVYDRFRNRLVFPILDAKGKAVGFSGRAMGKADAKYLNSPETPIFDKGSLMYNGAAAREAAWDGAQFVAVEGNVDVIASTRAGFATVAPMGTVLTEAHVKAMVKATDVAVICFDGDLAGRKAAARAIDLILPAVSPQFTAKFALLPDGQDPDSMVKRSPAAYAQAIADAVPLADLLWRRETVGIAPGVPEQRAKLEGRLRAALQLIQHPDTKRAYGAEFKDRLAALGQRPKVYRSNSYSQHSTSPSAGRLVNGFHRGGGLSLKEAIVIGAIAAAPMAALDAAEELSADDRLSPDALQLIGKLVSAISETPDGAIGEVLRAAGLADVVEEAIAKAGAAGVAMELGGEGDIARGVLTSVRRH